MQFSGTVAPNLSDSLCMDVTFPVSYLVKLPVWFSEVLLVINNPYTTVTAGEGCQTRRRQARFVVSIPHTLNERQLLSHRAWLQTESPKANARVSSPSKSLWSQFLNLWRASIRDQNFTMQKERGRGRGKVISFLSVHIMKKNVFPASRHGCINISTEKGLFEKEIFIFLCNPEIWNVEMEWNPWQLSFCFTSTFAQFAHLRQNPTPCFTTGCQQIPMIIYMCI